MEIMLSVENVCLASAVDMDIHFGRLRGNRDQYFCAKLKFDSSMGPAKIKINRT